MKGFSLMSDSSASKVVQGTIISCNSSKESSSYPSKAYHAAGGALAPGHAKPSALRMPSPSLGFFQQVTSTIMFLYQFLAAYWIHKKLNWAKSF